MASSYQTTGLESEKEEEEDNAMVALMRSTVEEIENCKLVRDIIESQRGQKEKQF